MKSTAEIFTEWLVLGCKEGDKKAFNILVKQWHPRIMKQAYWYCKDRLAAKDIAQETWTSVVKGINTIHDPARFSTWLNQIVYHKSIDWIRKTQKIRALNKTEVKEALYDINDDEGDDVKKMMFHLKQISEDQKIILTLFYLQQHNLIEIAEILSIPVGTVKSRLFNARETLKKKLKQ